jgi:hypothetical protein
MAERRKRGHSAFCGGAIFPKVEHFVFRSRKSGV